MLAMGVRLITSIRRFTAGWWWDLFVDGFFWIDIWYLRARLARPIE